MDEKPDSSLQQRVERLEAVVAELQTVLKQMQEASRQKELKETGSPPKAPGLEQAGAPPSPVKLPPERSQASRKSFELPENMRKSEYWLNKIGIGLVLFGVAFLFKYSVDQGWLTAPARIGFGVILGIGLIVTGLHISAERKHFSQVLIGGGIAVFYITGFAAFQLFALISHPVAFALMVSVTLLAFILSLKQNGAVLALIGAIGGLGTPFLLYTGTGNLPGLIGYTVLVLSGTSAIYFYRGWRSLLWTSVIGGWLVFLVGLTKGLPNDPQEAIVDRWALQLGVVFGWFAFWALPLIREVVWTKNPTGWPHPSFDFGEKAISQNTRVVLDRHVHLLSVSTPLIALAISMSIWSLSNETWGWITMGGALVYWLTSWNLKSRDAFKNLAYTHALEGVLLLTIALVLLLKGDALLFTLAAEAAVLHLIARRLSDKGIAIGAHFLFVAVGLWLTWHLVLTPVEGPAILNAQALTDLWVIGVALGVTKLFKLPDEQNIYRLAAHVAILAWFLRELSTLPNGQGYVTIAWGIYAVTLLVLGLRLNLQGLRTVAIGTLLIVVGKLFIVDLVELETIWRVLLFLGFGGLFLVLSYYFRALWKSNNEPSD